MAQPVPFSPAAGRNRNPQGGPRGGTTEGATSGPSSNLRPHNRPVRPPDGGWPTIKGKLSKLKGNHVPGGSSAPPIAH